MCNACGFLCCGSDLLAGCGCEDCSCLACRLVECDNCGEKYDVAGDHFCKPPCPKCGSRDYQVKKSYQGGYYITYKCNCGYEFGEDELEEDYDL